MTGEEEALIDELFTRYRTAMLGRALQYMKHVQDAEDVVSDAWMSLLRQLPKLVVMDERARSTYILRSVQNASYGGRLAGGVVVTGGGAAMPGVTDVVKVEFTDVDIRRGQD